MPGKRLHSEVLPSDEPGDSSGKLVSFKRSDVPAYLHESEFYLALEEDDDQEVLVPKECLKNDDTVSSVEDLRSLLLTLRFWVADEITESILDFVFNHPFETYEEVIAEFYTDIPELGHLKTIITAKKPFRKAINSDVLQYVQYMREKMKCEWPEDVCKHLAEKDQLSILDYAIKSGCVVSKEAAAVAAMYDHLDCLKLLHEHNCPWDESTTDAAASYDQLECLQYAHENGCPWRDATEMVNDNNGINNICTLAAASGHLACLQYAFCNGVPLQFGIVATAIAARREGALACVKFLHQQSIPLNHELLCEAAVWTNNFEMLQYLHENGCPWSVQCYLHSIDHCGEEVLNYLRINGCPWDASVCEYAAKEEDFHTVLYLLRHGCPPSDNIWRFTGDVFQQILQTFEEAGHTPDATPLAMTHVIQNGDLNVVKLMREKGFEWTEGVCAHAALSGSLELLQYVHDNGALGLFVACHVLMDNWSLENPVYTAELLECFKYAHQHSQCTLYKDYTFYAARDGQLELLSYLHEQGCKWDAKAAVAAAKNGHVECLEYLLSQGCAHSKDICIAATKRKQVKCLEVAKKYGCV